MSGIAAPPRPAAPASPAPAARGASRDRRGSWLPTWSLITTRFLELRRRRGLMFVVFLLTLGLPFIVLGLRLFFHAIDPNSYGPAGTPGLFQALSNPIAEFGFIIAAVVGATVGTTDLSEGVFRHLVVTGRSRLALYFARIPAALAMLFVLVALGYSSLCLVTGFAGTPQPSTLNTNGISVPLYLSQPQLETWLLDHTGEAAQAGLGPIGPIGGGGKGGGVVTFGPNGPNFQLTPAEVRQQVRSGISAIYSDYTSAEVGTLNPPANEMVKIGLWIELEVLVGFLVGLGFGSLTGQRTLATVVMIVLEIILTPILAGVVIPYFLNGQRLIVGVALDQMRPEWLTNYTSDGGHGGRVILGGRGLGIPPMPTWAMIAVIVGWLVVWTGVGAWKMARRDA